jgi:NADH:ubiquinone oxidoreductase subunit 6 (subunit J)
MGPITTIAMVLVIIYAAAILLAVLDKIDPPELNVARQPRNRMLWTLPLWIPAILLSLTMWLVVFGPVLIWRSFTTPIRDYFNRH